MVDGDHVLDRFQNFMSIERGVNGRDGRPGVSVGGCLACVVAGVKLRERSVDVIEVERDAYRDPAVGIELDDAEHLGVKSVGLLFSAREGVAAEGEALPAGRDGSRRGNRHAEVCGGPHARDGCIATVQYPSVDHLTAVLVQQIFGQHLRYVGPVTVREVRHEALEYSTCRVGQPRGPWPQFVEPRDRDVEVYLVEQLAAVELVALYRHEVEKPPLGLEALWRNLASHLGDDRSEVA